MPRTQPAISPSRGWRARSTISATKDVHCPHGFRPSASTLLNAERVVVEGNELPRFSERVIEFQLEHVNKTVAAVYNRNQRLPERVKMMQFWADKCDAIRDGKTGTKLRVVA
jgi:integrase